MHRTSAVSWKRLVPALAALLAAAAPVGPDYWVGMGPGSATTPPPAIRVTGGVIRREGVVVGNSGGAGQYQQLVMLNVTSEDGTQQVCGISRTVAPPTMGHAVAPIAFQVFYAGGRVLIWPRYVRYKLVATVAQPNNGAPYEDANTGNNTITVVVVMPGGGRPACVQTPTLSIGRKGVE